jgi:nucleoside transporter
MARGKRRAHPEKARVAADPAGPPAGTKLLAAAIFLQNFAIGAWVVTLGSYLKAHAAPHGQQLFAAGFVGTAYATSALGAMLAPLATGILVDRGLRAHRVTACLSLVSAAILWVTADASSQTAFHAGLLAFFVCYMPTVSLLIAMILQRLPDPDRQYPRIRAWGTVGWVAAGIVVGVGGPLVTGSSIELSSAPLKIGAAALGILACVCWAVPAVAARQPTQPVFRWRNVGRLATQQGIWQLLAIGVLVSIAPQFYNNYGNVYFNALQIPYAAAKLTLGQVAEVIGILLMPATLARFHPKGVILAGLATWVLRFALLSGVDGPRESWAVFLAVLLQGVAFPLAFIPLQLEMHRRAADEFRATAQGLLLIASSGVGTLIGARLAGFADVRWLGDQLLGGGQALGEGWSPFWRLPAVGSCLSLVAVAFLWQRSEQEKTVKSVESEKSAGIALRRGYTQRCP